MCVSITGEPAFVPGSVYFEREPALITYKVLKGREHVSSHGMAYPLGQTLVDPKAVLGDHTRCIHMVPSEDVARSAMMKSYGDHIMAMLVPVSRIWTNAVSSSDNAEATRVRCWHTDTCLPIWCH